MQDFADISDIFGLWPSIREMASELAEKPDTVGRWRKRRRIPESAWPAVIAKGQARTSTHKISADVLLRLNAPAKRRGRPPKDAAA